MGTTRFFLFCEKGQSLKENKNVNIDKQTINIVYSVLGDRKFFRTKVKLYALNWDQANQKAVYVDKKKAKAIAPNLYFDLLLTLKEADKINTIDLGGLRQEVLDIENDFTNDFKKTGLKYTSQMVVDELKTRNRPTIKVVKTDVLEVAVKSKSLCEVFQDFIDHNQHSRASGSMNSYKNVKRFLGNYEKVKGVVAPNTINKEFMEKFNHYINTVEKIANVTSNKTMRSFKTLLKYAKSKGFNIPDTYRDFKPVKAELEVIALSMDEMNTIFNLDLSKNKRLDGVRDCFILSCATGLRYSDLEQLNRSHIKENTIEITIKKTKRKLTIPLNPYSRAVIDKYKNQLNPIPIISNVKFNQYLKEIGVLAGMDEIIEIVRYRGSKAIKTQKTKAKLLTVHVGRKTFATLSLELGMPEWAAMEIGGWESHSAFKRYTKYSEKRKSDLMAAAWGV